MQESVAQTSSGSCPRHILTVISEVLGGNGSKPSGAGIELGDHLWRGSFLGCKDGCGTVVATEGIGDIGGYREADAVNLADFIPVVFGKGLDDSPKHADATVARRTAA